MISMIRKVLSVPESVAHYSFGSVLLVAHLVAMGVKQQQTRPA